MFIFANPEVTDIHAISLWRYEAVRAMFQDDDAQEGRRNASDYFSQRLGHMFSPLIDHRDPADLQAFMKSARKEIIEPAFNLYNLMIQEKHLYYLEFNHFINKNGQGPSEFHQNLDNQSFTIALPGGGRRQLDQEKEPADDSLERKRARVSKLFVLAPALLTQRITEENGLEEPQVLVKQRTLITLDGGLTGLISKTPNFLQELKAQALV